jgi:hypothetical protein
MRPPVTRWAYNNVFVRMVVVAVALLTGVAVLGGISASPALAQIPEPAARIHVGPPNSIVGQGAWIDGATVTVTVDDPDDVYDRDDLTAIAGSDTIYGDSWRIEDDSLGLQAGFVVSATDGTTTRTHVVKPITFASADLDSGTVSGSTTLVGDDWVEVALFSDVCRRRNVDVNGEGVFVADFSVSGGELDDEAATCVLDEGSFGSVEQYDDDGDLTFVMWRVPNPSFSVEAPFQVWSNGEDWPLGIPVEVVVDDDDAFDLNDSGSFLCYASTSIQSWGDNPWDQGFNVKFDDPDNPCEIVPGNIVTVFSDADGVDGPEIYKDLLVVDLSITEVDSESGVITGYAPPEAWVTVNGGNEFENVGREVQAESDADVDPGYWTVDLATEPLDPFDGSGALSVPFASNTGGSAQVFDNDGDSTHRGWCHDCDGGGEGQPGFQVDPPNSVWAESPDWQIGAPVDLAVYDGYVSEGTFGPLLYEANTTVALQEGWDNPGFYFDLNAAFEILPGHVVSIVADMDLDDEAEFVKEHEVTPLDILSADAGTDTVTGTAAPGSTVDVWVHGSEAWIQVTACDDDVLPCSGDDPGTWHAGFAMQADLVPGSNGNSAQCDDDGDCTMANWGITNPTFVVRPSMGEYGPVANGLIAFNHYQGLSYLSTVNPDGTDIIHLHADGGGDGDSKQDPSWAPDGSAFAYGLDTGGGPDIAVVPYPLPDGCYTAIESCSTRVASEGFTEQNPAWSPQGDQIAYEASVGTFDMEIYVVPAGGGIPVNVSNNPEQAGNERGTDREPTWAPDGSRIAFSSNRTGPYQIWTVAPDGSDPQQLTDLPRAAGNPAWSPDGTQIAFATEHPDRPDIVLWVMDADGQNPHVVVDAAPLRGQPEWAPDGSEILFYRYGSGIWAVAPDGTGLRFVVAGTQPAWQPVPGPVEVHQPPAVWGNEFATGVEIDIAVNGDVITSAIPDDSGWFDVQFDESVTILPNDRVEIESAGTAIKSHDVFDVVIQSIDPDLAVVSGYGPPDSQFQVGVDWISRQVQSDENGFWLADFANPGVEDWEQDTILTFDPGTGGWVEVFDEDGDATHIDWCFECDGGGNDLWMEPFSVEPGQLLISQTDGVLWVYDPQANDGAGEIVNELPLPFGGVWDIRWGDPGFLYLANSGAGRVLRLDMGSGQFEVLFEGDPLSFPIGVAFDNREDSALFIADNEQGVFNLDIDGPGGIPQLSSIAADGIEFGPDGLVYFTTGGSDQVFQVDPYAATPAAVQIIGGDMPYRFNGLVFSPQGTLLATSVGPPAVVEFEYGSWEILNEYLIPDAIFTEDVAVGLDGMLYVIDSSCDESSCGSDPALWRVDPETGMVEELVDHGPFGDVVDLLVMPDSPPGAHMKVYSTTAAPGWTDIVDVEGFNQGATLDVERDGVAFSFDPVSEFEIDPGVWHALFMPSFDILPGDLVSVTDGDTMLSTEVTNLTIETVDRENLVLTGQARPNHELGVQFFPWRQGELDGTLWETQIETDGSGGWYLDLQALGAPVDLGPGTWWSIADLDAGTETGTYVESFTEPELYVVLNPLALPSLPDFPEPDTSTVIGGAGWVLGGGPGYADVQVTVTDADGGEKWSGTATPDIGLPDAQPSEFGFRNVPLVAGDTVTAVQTWTAVGTVFGVEPPMWSRELVVGSATVTSVDVEADTVSGTAPIGATVWMPHPEDDEAPLRVIDTSTETWTADFSDGSEWPAWDIGYGELFATAEIDDDGDGTWMFWRTPEPVLGVDRPLDGPDAIFGDGWLWETDTTLTITGNDELPVTITDVSDKSGSVVFETLGVDLLPGMVVELTDGVYTRSLVVEDLDHSQDPTIDPGVIVDPAAGTVSGYAMAGSEVCIEIVGTDGTFCVTVSGDPGELASWTISDVPMTYDSNVILTIVFDFTIQRQEIPADPPPDVIVDYPGPGDGIDAPFDIYVIDYVTGCPLQLTVDWGDDTAPHVDDDVAPFSTVELTHTFPKAGVYTVTVTVLEPCSYSGATHSFDVQIENTPPVIENFEGPIDPYALGFEGFVAGTFADPNTDDVITVEVDWGDGTVTTPSFDLVGSLGSLDDSHFYSTPGIYTITLTVRDDSGGSDTAEYESAVVFDPDGKSISGSPEVVVGDVSDKVNFSVKYDKKTGNPEGHLNYTHKDADGKAKFEAEEIQYLWIFGDWAFTQGQGTLDSTGEEYEFLLVILDGARTGTDDMFRFKLWNANTLEVFYDSQPGDSSYASPTTVPTKGNIKVKLK